MKTLCRFPAILSEQDLQQISNSNLADIVNYVLRMGFSTRKNSSME